MYIYIYFFFGWGTCYGTRGSVFDNFINFRDVSILGDGGGGGECGEFPFHLLSTSASVIGSSTACYMFLPPGFISTVLYRALGNARKIQSDAPTKMLYRLETVEQCNIFRYPLYSTQYHLYN